MNTDSYKVLKLSNGEMIVCEINDYDDKIYDIMNPLRMDVVPIQSRSGIGETLNLTPWMQHFTDQKYFNIEKNQCILIADASVGLSKYYEYVMLRIDDSWDNGDNLIPEDDTDEDVYDDLLEEIKAESKLIH
jgi:hypothetical protein|tara:strand:+ start:764 stop:1159 length:396 start_codon:yes stop_codon:yes gene_type:complete